MARALLLCALALGLASASTLPPQCTGLVKQHGAGIVQFLANIDEAKEIDVVCGEINGCNTQIAQTNKAQKAAAAASVPSMAAAAAASMAAPSVALLPVHNATAVKASAESSSILGFAAGMRFKETQGKEGKARRAGLGSKAAKAAKAAVADAVAAEANGAAAAGSSVGATTLKSAAARKNAARAPAQRGAASGSGSGSSVESALDALAPTVGAAGVLGAAGVPGPRGPVDEGGGPVLG